MTTVATAPTIDAFIDADAEQMVLGACLLRETAFPAYARHVQAADFSRLHHRLIWDAMQTVHAQGDPVSPITVRAALQQAQQLDKVGGFADLTRLTEWGLMAGRDEEGAAQTLTSRLRQCRVARDLVYHYGRALRELEADPSILRRGFLERLRDQLTTLGETASHRQIPSHLMSFGEVMTEIEAQWTGGPPEFIHTPWPDLDDRLEGGIVPGELIILGARPGAGKTAAAAQIALKVARSGRSVVIVSREMKRTQIGGRLIAIEGSVDAGAIRRVRFTLDQEERAKRAMLQLGRLPGFITDAPMSIDALRELVDACQQEAPLGLLIVDYLQLIDPPAHVKDRRLQVEAVSAGLKKITLDCNLPVLALSSLSRGMDERAKPSLRSLRESGNIEHDADTVLLLHRPDQDELADLIVAKARQGRPGDLQLLFNAKHQRFDQVERHQTGV